MIIEEDLFIFYDAGDGEEMFEINLKQIEETTKFCLTISTAKKQVHLVVTDMFYIIQMFNNFEEKYIDTFYETFCMLIVNDFRVLVQIHSN